MIKSINHYANKTFFIFMLLSLCILSACKLDNSQQVIVKFSTPVEIKNNILTLDSESQYSKDLEIINSLNKQHKVLLSYLFTDKKNSLNENQELNNYLVMNFKESVQENTITNIIKELEQLEIVETAYQAPIGEDAGISLPES